MPGQPDFLTGWIDTTIHEFLLDSDEPASSMAYALIACLDGNPAVSELLQKSKHLNGLATKSRVVGEGLLLKTRQLQKAEHENRLFFGFDEVQSFPLPW